MTEKITQKQLGDTRLRDGCRLVEHITAAVALAKMFHPDVLESVADYVEGSRFSQDEDEREIVRAYVRYLRKIIEE